nr:SAV_2336 N-terminal domain-related protein [Streptomyces sp. SID5468]
MLDALWLAGRLPADASAPLARAVGPVAGQVAGSGVPGAAPSGGPVPEEAEAGTEPTPGAAAVGALHSGPAVRAPRPAPDAVPPAAPRPARPKALPVRVPEEKALRGTELGLGRSLRPLKQRRPRTRGWELDEAATAAALAETGLPDVVLRPARERWLDLVLVVDDGLSMLLWHRLAVELRALLERLGAFRTVRVFGLDSRCAGGPVLRGRPFAPGSPVLSPAVPADPTGQTLVLVVSDGVGPAWRDGRMWPVLDGWARLGPVAVVHALPARMWPASGIRAADWRVTVRQRGAANAAWTVTDPVLPAELVRFEGMPVPVLEPEPLAVARWARLVASPGGSAVLPLLSREPTVVPRSPAAGAAAPAADPVLRFRNAASPEAYRLAAHLAAVAPVSVPVMRLVQSAVRVETAHLAEVFLGGLMRRTDSSGAGVSPRESGFDFTERDREILLDTVPAAELVGTGRAVSARLAELSGHAPDFPAWLAHPDGLARLPAHARPFALAGQRMMARLGAGVAVERQAPEAGEWPDSLADLLAAASGRRTRRRWERPRTSDPAVVGPFTVRARDSAEFQYSHYLAEDADGDLAVVKVYRNVYSGRATAEREAEALRRMAGRFAPVLVDADTGAARPWVAFRAAGGDDPLGTGLDEIGAEAGALWPRPAFRTLARLLAEGVALCHQEGMVHGALGLSRFRLTASGPWLVGWEHVAIDGRGAGPSGRTATAADDVSALGRVLVAMATGEARNIDYPEVLRAALLLQADDDIDLRDLLLSCASGVPGSRPTARRIADAFAGSPSPPQRPGTELRKPPRPAVGKLGEPSGAAPAEPSPPPAAPGVPDPAELWLPRRRAPWAKATLQRQADQVRTPVAGCHRIAVVGGRRFAGTRTVALVLASFLAAVRGGGVLLLTDDPAALGGPARTPVSLSELASSNWWDVETSAVTHPSGLRVLLVSRRPGTTPEAYARALDAASQGCRILIVDAGSDHAVFPGSATGIQQYVLVPTPGARAELPYPGPGDVVVVSRHHGSEESARDLAGHYTRRGHAVVTLPYDLGLAARRVPDPGLLSAETRQRYLDLALLLAEGFR